MWSLAMATTHRYAHWAIWPTENFCFKASPKAEIFFKRTAIRRHFVRLDQRTVCSAPQVGSRPSCPSDPAHSATQIRALATSGNSSDRKCGGLPFAARRPPSKRPVVNRIRPRNSRVLAIAPSSKGFGFAVLEGQVLVDWGVRSVGKGDKNAQCVRKVEKLGSGADE